MKSNIGEEYSQLVIKIKQLELLKAEMTKKITDHMNEQGITNDENEFGSCILSWRKNWEYSNQVQHLEVQLKEAKIREQNNGVAIVSDQTEYLRFIPKKD